ncbi:MAG: sterol desaturase/sphingolipid hydroxylase (fatty acid hydroxylase superfamily) [Alphaproteobacteria bacterium]|jgi:sterol desaturase/sphingolipid hydroxylase (fatty acid hydroxylase superfamily)
MLEIIEIFESSAKAIYIGVSNLFMLAILFFFFSFLVNGKKVFDAISASFSSGVFNIALMSLNIVVVTPIILVISKYSYSFQLAATFWNAIPEPFVIFCAVFAADFIGYWRHRLEHTRALWPSHSIHHSDTNMTWLTLQRFHPINRLSTHIIDSSILLAMGFPLYAVFAAHIVRHYYGYFIHANIPWNYGKWSLVFVSPVMHRWHHADDSSAYNTNFATVFSIFDRFFGTYRVPGLCDVPLGVSRIGNNSFLSQMLYPFKFSSYISPKKAIASNNDASSD